MPVCPIHNVNYCSCQGTCPQCKAEAAKKSVKPIINVPNPTPPNKE